MTPLGGSGEENVDYFIFKSINLMHFDRQNQAALRDSMNA